MKKASTRFRLVLHPQTSLLILPSSASLFLTITNNKEEKESYTGHREQSLTDRTYLKKKKKKKKKELAVTVKIEREKKKKNVED